RQQSQGTVGTDGIDLGEIDAGQLVERGANLEPGLIVPRLLPGAGRGHRARGRRRLGGQREDVRLNRGIAGGQLMLIGVEEFEVLLEHEDVLGPVVPSEGSRDLGRRGLTPVVARLREGLRVRVAGNDVPENEEAGGARDMYDDAWEGVCRM